MWTPVHEAASKGNIARIKFLFSKDNIKQHYAVDEKAENFGRTALWMAVDGGHFDAVKLLLQLNADINVEDELGRGLLHACSSKGHLEIVDYLLIEKELDPNLQDKNGNTPYHVAAIFGNIEVLRCLVEAGAKPVANKKNETPADLAKEESVKKILKCWEDMRVDMVASSQ